MDGVPFSNTLHPTGCPRDPPFGATLDQNGQKSPQKGVPPFWPLFQEGSRNPDPIFADFRKKSAEISPAAGPSLGGGVALFFSRKSAKTRFGFLLPLQNRVFRGGGCITPHSGAREKIFFDFFFLVTTSGGPILGPFWTHFGHFG